MAARCSELFGHDGLPDEDSTGPSLGLAEMDDTIPDLGVVEHDEPDLLEEEPELDPPDGPDPEAAPVSEMALPVSTVVFELGSSVVVPGADITRLVSAWPAQLACVFTLLLGSGLPMARDASGALWWWHITRIWKLGGVDLAAAAVAWGAVTLLTLLSSCAIWMGSSESKSLVLKRNAVMSILLASAAWATGMAGGIWTLGACLIIPVAVWAALDAIEGSAVAGNASLLTRLSQDRWPRLSVAAGALSTVGAIAGVAMEGGAPTAVAAALSALCGCAMIAAGIVRMSSRPAGWIAVVTSGALMLACAALLCDGIAAAFSTPDPPTSGTRFAMLDAARVIAVLLCQCGLAYLARSVSKASTGAPRA